MLQDARRRDATATRQRDTGSLAGLWVTAVLLARQAGGRDRIVYNLTEA
jgi:hypothetical protein